MSASIDHITIKNDETLVQFLLADEYEAYRKEFPEVAIEVFINEEVEGVEFIEYTNKFDDFCRLSYFKSLHPEEFAEAVRRIREYGEGKR